MFKPQPFAVNEPIVKVLHKSSATAVGGRAGHTRNSDGVVDVKLSLPESLGGKGIQEGMKKYN